MKGGPRVPMEQREPKVYEYLEALSEDRLNQLLLEAVEADEMDVELIQRINAALSAKSDHAERCDVDAAWQEFSSTWRENEPLYDYEEFGIPTQRTSESQAKTKHTRIRCLSRTAIVAAVIASILALTMLAASAFGVNIWASIAEWSDDHFSFSGFSDTAAHPDDLFGQLRADLEARGVTANVVPTYFPEGFTVEEYYVFDDTVRMGMTRDDERVYLIYDEHEGERIHLLGNGVMTKDEGNPEIVEINGVAYYIMTNMGVHKAAWINDGIECDITGFLNKDELKRVIESIY